MLTIILITLALLNVTLFVLVITMDKRLDKHAHHLLVCYKYIKKLMEETR